MPYDAFLSYSHAADASLASALQSGLQQFAKPWNRLRSMRVFRDKTGLSANPALWSSIELALDDSETFILLSSRVAAKSDWVSREIEHWLSRKTGEKMFLVLTEGEITWDLSAGDFNWVTTTALPRNLAGRFKEQPLWIDLRWAQNDERLSPQNPDFREVIADLSSAVRGIPKDQLIGEEVRQHRNTVFFRRTALCGLAALTVLLACTSILAWHQRNLARQNQSIADLNASIAQQNADLAAAKEKTAKDNEARAQINQALAEKNAGLAKSQENIARSNEAQAIVRQFLAQSLAVRGADPALSVALAANAFAIASQRSKISSNEAEQQLHTALLASPLRRVLRGGIVQNLSWSPDGKRLVTSEGQIWDPITGIQLFTLSPFHRPASGLFWSPDGKRLAIEDSERTLSMWDLAGQSRVFSSKIFFFHVGQSNFSWSPTGDRFVIASGSNAAEIIDSSTGDVLHTLTNDPDPIANVAWSPDGMRVATQGLNGRATVWNAQTGALLFKLPRQVKLFSWRPDGTELATVGQDDISIWNGSSGEEVRTWNAGVVYTISWSPDGKLLATTFAKIVTVWEPRTGSAIQSFQSGGRVEAIVWNPNSIQLAVRSLDDANVWDMDGNIVRRLSPLGLGHGLAWSPDGKYIATGDEVIKIWHAGLGEDSCSIDLTGITKVAWSPDGRRLAIASRWHDPKIVDVEECSELFTVSQSNALSNDIIWKPDGQQFATVNGLDPPRVWDSYRGTELLELSRYVNVGLISWSPDGNQLAIVNGWEDLKLLYAKSGDEILTINDTGTVRFMDWSSDGARLVTWDYYKQPRFWNIKNGKELLMPHKPGSAVNVAWSSVPRWIAVSGDNNKLHIWDVIEGNEVLALSTGGAQYAPKDFAWSPDGTKIAMTGGGARTVQVWDIKRRKPLWSVLLPVDVYSVAWSPDGNQIITSSYGDRVRLWAAGTGQELFSLEIPDASRLFWSPTGSHWALTSRGGIQVFAATENDLMNIARKRIDNAPLSEENCRRELNQPKCPQFPAVSSGH